MSTPVSGVEMRNDAVAPLLAPLFFSDVELAQNVQQRHARGEDLDALIEELSIPPITHPRSRAAAYREGRSPPDRHYETSVIDEGLWRRSVSSAPFSELTSLRPGSVSGVHAGNGGHLVFVVHAVHPPETLPPESARALARGGLGRAAIDALVDDVLGPDSPASSAPPDRQDREGGSGQGESG